MSDNYNITPPSLKLADMGPAVYMVGFNQDDISEITSIFETFLPNSGITFYYDLDEMTESTAAWARAVSSMSEYIIVNADTINITELYVVMMGASIGNATHENIFWMTFDESTPLLSKLMNSFKDQPQIVSFDHLRFALSVNLGMPLE